MLFKDADPQDFKCKDEDANLVYYAELMIGQHMVMMHDDNAGLLSSERSNSQPSLTTLCISFDSEEKARVAHEILSVGATTIDPIKSGSFFTFMVTLTDKFGVTWDLYFGEA